MKLAKFTELIPQISCFLNQVSEGVRRGHGRERGTEKADQLLGERKTSSSAVSEAALSKERSSDAGDARQAGTATPDEEQVVARWSGRL